MSTYIAQDSTFPDGVRYDALPLPEADGWGPDTVITEQFENVSAQALKVYFPKGSTVTVNITDHRRVTRSGKSLSTLLVLASFDGKVSNVSGWVASALDLGRTEAWTPEGTSTRVNVVGLGTGEVAADVLVAQLGEDLYGDAFALKLHIV